MVAENMSLFFLSVNVFQFLVFSFDVLFSIVRCDVGTILLGKYRRVLYICEW